MKRLLPAVLAALLLLTPAAAAAGSLEVSAPSVLLMEKTTGSIDL